MTELTINKQYAIEDESRGQSFPALQATDYQPKNSKVVVNIGLSDESTGMLTDDAIFKLKFETETVSYGETEVTLHIPTSEVRWVIVGRPKLFLFDKDNGEYSLLQKGQKLKGTKKVTIAKLFLGCVCNGELLLTDEGKPQLFTLNLKSSKTALIGGYRSQPGDGTIESLNKGLNKHYDCKGWLTHLVSVDIKAVPERFTSGSGESSLGIKYVLEGSARILPEEQQKMMFEVANDREIKEIINDPFRVGSPSQAQEQPSSQQSSSQTETVEEEIDYDEIPF